MPTHHKAEAHVDAWIDDADIAEESKRPLFRTFGRNGEVTARPLYEADVLRIVKVRGKAIGLPASTCCHTFRATSRLVSRKCRRVDIHFTKLAPTCSVSRLGLTIES